MYAMLLAPKLMSAAAAHRAGIAMRDVGGLRQFLLSVIVEISLSIAYAPILMVQQTGAVVRTLLGARAVWNPQQRQGKHYTLGVMIKFHAFETLIGILLVAGMMQGLVTLWLLPIAVSLVLAIPLSALSGINLSNRRWSSRQMGTPEHLNAPQIIRTAMIERRRFADLIEGPVPIAAE
jgi:membrane glycosyltransferase